MSRLFRALWHARAVFALVLLCVGSLSAQVLLYVPAEGANQLWEYGITTANGNLFNYPNQAVNGNQPNVVAVTPNNRFLYVGSADGTIDAFLVNYDGTLAAVGAPFANAGGVRGLAIDGAGKFLFVSDNPGAQVKVFSINQTTGALTAIPGSTNPLPGAAQPRGMVADNAGHLYITFAALDQVGQYSINPTTGALTQIAPPINAGTTPDRVAITPNGAYLYVTNYFGLSISVYSIAGNGALSANGAPVSTGSPSRPLGVTVHQNGNFLIVTLNSALVANNVVVYSIAGNGLLTQVGAVAAGSLASGVAVDPTGNYVYVANAGGSNITKFNFNTSTGALTVPAFFATGAVPQFLVSRPAPLPPVVPTLSTWSLVALGMLLAGASTLMYRRAYR